MPYPESCFTDLIGIRGICEPVTPAPLYWVDDIPGINLDNLAAIVNASVDHTGKKFGEQLIERAARMMAADVEAIYDGVYKVENMLVNGCSACTFLTNYATGDERGILIKNNTLSAFSILVIDKITAKVNEAGTFTIVVDDGETERLIPITFDTPGQIVDVINVKYETRRKEVRIYLLESNVPLAQLSCPRKSSGCGCSGKSIVVDDLIYTGTAAGVESQQAYGFLPCAFIRCEAADLLCFTAHSAPRMIGMGLLYKVAELYFTDRRLTTRNNRLGGTDEDKTDDESKRYGKLYIDKLNGKGTRGVKDLVKTALSNVNDVCVVCDAKMGTAWATT
jgi:hypothetical protein